MRKRTRAYTKAITISLSPEQTEKLDKVCAYSGESPRDVMYRLVDEEYVRIFGASDG